MTPMNGHLPATRTTTLAAVSIVAIALAAATANAANPNDALTYPIVDTGQVTCFSDRGQIFTPPAPGQAFYGQDAFYQTNPARYRDNGDGTVSDLVTGLMWTAKLGKENERTFGQAVAGAKTCHVGGHDDWRLPTIKELYSLMNFNGCVTTRNPVPYLDTRFFEFRFGNTAAGHRIIDAQYWSSTQYVGRTMDNQPTVFGVNFADGRIKGYPRDRGRIGGRATHFVRYVRGNPSYGRNRLVDNGDGTVSDLATGLMWTKADSAKPKNWAQALAWAENLKLAGHDDWRLPDAKELQSIVDYTRAPHATDPSRRGPAIDPAFTNTDPEGWYWSSTTHLDGPQLGAHGVYVAFGQATGFMFDRHTGRKRKMDVHGAGAQRSDPKSGDPNRWPEGLGPQGDERRIYNYARAVRNIDPSTVKRVKPSTEKLPYQFDPSQMGDPNVGPGGPAGRPDGRMGPPPRRGGYRRF